MALKESMDILIKDMKIQDARIEADRQTYAGLLSNVQKHTEELKKRKEEKERFEQFLSRIGGERDFFKDSVQIRTLEDLALAQEREIADNNNLIKEHQAYYEALRKKDYQALWRRDEDKSIIAAICFAVEQWRDTSAALVRKLLETRDELSEDAARYLLEKVLVYSESKREADEAAEEADILLRDILSRTRFPQSDAVWQNIETCLNIRKTWRTMVKCKTVLNVYQEQKSRFETFEEDYANNCREILAEIKKLENQKIGGEVTSAVKSTKEWFVNRTAELDSLIKRRRNETAIIEEHLQTLQSIHAELENGMESGLQPERCDAICNTLNSMESEAAEVVDAGKLERERKKLLEDYQTHLKTIEAAKDAEVEREKEHQRIKIHKKADRKRKLPKLVLKILIAVVVIFGLETFNVEVLGMGLFYYLPDIAFNNRIMVINDSISPYYITLVPKSTIQINSGIDLSFVIDPFGAEYLCIDPPIKKLKIHEGTKTVRLNCEKLKKLTIPDSVTEMTLLGLKDELALTLELPEHLKTLHIEQSPDLTDIGFQDIEIPESVRDLSIEGDNLENIDIPVDLDSLTIGGAENLTVNVSGNVLDLKVVHAESLKSLTVNVSGYVDQLFDFSAESGTNFESLKNLTVNVSGCVNDLIALSEENITVDVSGEVRSIDALCKENLTVNVDGALYYYLDVYAENLTVNGNGTVHVLDTGYSPDYPEMKNVTVNAKIDICRLTMGFSEERGESIPHIEFSEVPKALELDYNAENELIIPEGAELLKLYYWESEEVPVIPDSVRYLSIVSDTLDFDAVNIPEGILYYKLISLERNEQREYQDENCPDALAHFDFNDPSGIIPDLSGL